MSGMDRRSFFKIVATTGAAAAAGGCGPSAEQFIPYVIPPDNIVPGIPAYFSTVCRECPSGCGLIAKNRDGRVIKLEGNPDHPTNTGSLCIRAHAGLQGLYHPDRFRGPLAGGKPVTWDEAEKQLTDKLGALAKARQGARIAVVSGLETGSLGRLMDEWTRLLGARPRIAYEPLGYESIRAANRVAFGRDAIPDYAIGDATYLVSFGADFLETWLNCEGYTADFARMHAFYQGKQGTFVHVEPRLSLTASNADQWLRNAPGTEGLLALAMLRVIVDDGLHASGADLNTLRAAARAGDVEGAATASGIPAETIKQVARDLARSRGGLVIGGGMAVDRVDVDRHPGGGQPAQRGHRRSGHARALRLRPAARQGEPVLGPDGADPGDGGRPDRRAGAGRRQPGVRDAAQVGLHRGARQGPAGGGPRGPADRDHRARPRGAADPALARVLGRLRVARKACSGSCSRPWVRCRSSARPSPRSPPATSSSAPAGRRSGSRKARARSSGPRLATT